uniref:Uncharacterized protein n=1 Tax=Cyprinus carpio TaxID=7962 RepID=A0A8C2EE07_CYPCA
MTNKHKKLKKKLNIKMNSNSKYQQKLFHLNVWCVLQVAQYEAQVARLRAQVERGEAQRQTMEYDIAVVRRDAAAERRNTEEKMNDLKKDNQITQQARDDDLKGLTTELHERDHLLLSANAENDLLQADKSRLQTLIQVNICLSYIKFGRMKRDREKNTEKLKHRSTELNRSTEREEKLRCDLEVTLQKVKVLEQSVESERAAHLQSKFNSEIIQVTQVFMKKCNDCVLWT